MNNQKPQYFFDSPPIAEIDDLQKENKFSEAFIFAWGIIEYHLDIAVLEEFNLKNVNDPRTKMVLSMDFEDKLVLQKKLNWLKKSDFKVVNALQRRRNSFFHKNGYFISKLSEEEKQEILNLAKNAIVIVLNIVKDVHNARIQRQKEKG